MSQMSRNLSPPRAEPVKRGLPTFSSLLSTVIWVKNCRSKKGLKQCLGGLKCSQNTKKNKTGDAKGKLQSDIQCTFC